MGYNGAISADCGRESHAKTDKATRYAQIVAVLERGPKTAREVMTALGYTDLNAVRPRLTELDRMGRIRQIGKEYDPVSERNVTVYSLPDDWPSRETKERIAAQPAGVCGPQTRKAPADAASIDKGAEKNTLHIKYHESEALSNDRIQGL